MNNTENFVSGFAKYMSEVANNEAHSYHDKVIKLLAISDEEDVVRTFENPTIMERYSKYRKE